MDTLGHFAKKQLALLEKLRGQMLESQAKKDESFLRSFLEALSKGIQSAFPA